MDILTRLIQSLYNIFIYHITMYHIIVYYYNLSKKEHEITLLKVEGFSSRGWAGILTNSRERIAVMCTVGVLSLRLTVFLVSCRT